MEQKSCLFLINGLGLGNSTRCHAVMEHLAERGMEIHVLTSGNGVAYFSNKKEVASLTSMEAFSYAGNGDRVSGLGTLGSLGRLRQVARIKRQQLEDLLNHLHPDIAVTDSEYATAPLRRRGIPVVGLNNAEVVVAEYLRTRHTPGSIRSHFWLVEFMDYLFHRTLCDLVISPSARPVKVLHPKFKRVGLIIRRALYDEVNMLPRREFPLPRDMRSVVFMLSGSVFASTIPFENARFPFAIDVVGRDGPNQGSVQFHGRLMNNIALLKKADALVVNGGFSAVSEAVALNKPTFVIPVRGHAEQYINARAVSALGLGYVADEKTVLNQLRHLHEANRWEGLGPRMPTMGFDGARETADILCEFLATRNTPTARRDRS